MVFTGSTAALPVLSTSGRASVGLYAGDLHTSRAADLRVLPSVTTPGGAPADPAEDVYDQLTEKLNRLIAVQPESVAQAVADYQTWQRAIGRDINPSKLVALVMEAGAKRVTVTAPTYTAVAATKVSALQGEAVISYGGLEDD